MKVKLTERGISVLEEKHRKLNDSLTQTSDDDLLEKVELSFDEDGYYVTQLWKLMGDFGNELIAGKQPPFKMDMIMQGGTPKQTEITL